MEAWTSPTFEEIKMDAEIGSYQEDRDPMRDEGPWTRGRSARSVRSQADEAAE